MPLAQPTDRDMARFLRRVILIPPPEGKGLILPCWKWIGGQSKGKGNTEPYGTFWFDGTGVRAHRFSLWAFRGQDTEPGEHRDHLCVRALCVCPWHLEVVTHEVNNQRRWGR